MDRARYNRLAQAKHRGSKRSYKTELENAQILLAWLNADLSEGQVSKALGLDRIATRTLRDQMIADGVALFERMRSPVDAHYDGICGRLPQPGRSE